MLIYYLSFIWLLAVAILQFGVYCTGSLRDFGGCRDSVCAHPLTCRDTKLRKTMFVIIRWVHIRIILSFRVLKYRFACLPTIGRSLACARYILPDRQLHVLLSVCTSGTVYIRSTYKEDDTPSDLADRTRKIITHIRRRTTAA